MNLKPERVGKPSEYRSAPASRARPASWNTWRSSMNSVAARTMTAVITAAVRIRPARRSALPGFGRVCIG